MSIEAPEPPAGPDHSAPMAAAAAPPAAISLELQPYGAQSEALQRIRRQVFIEEQAVPEHEEWDGRDAECLHVLARSADGSAIGCARLFPDGRIGRMAVLAPWRGQGVGRRMLDALVAHALERGNDTICLDAQLHALAFYERAGFVAQGEVFMDAGIPHRFMAYGQGSNHSA